MTDGLPHERVFARLGISPISGVGVFAIRDIPQGTDLFPNGKRPAATVEFCPALFADAGSGEAIT